MATKAQAQQDREMAARLKKEGDKREVARCPICNAVVSMNNFINHVQFHN